MQPTIFHNPAHLMHVDSRPVSGALGYILGVWFDCNGEGSLYPDHNPTTPAPAGPQDFVLQIARCAQGGEMARVLADGTIYFCTHEYTSPTSAWSMLRP